jgi:hypothetical protein
VHPDENFLPIEDLNEGSFAIVLSRSTTPDRFHFRLHTGVRNSPLLYLVKVRDTKIEENRVLWRWYRPHNDAYVIKQSKRLDRETCSNPGFVDGGNRREAWSPYDLEKDGADEADCIISDEHILLSWDNDDDDGDGVIPGEQYDQLISRLKAHMSEDARAKRQRAAE